MTHQIDARVKLSNISLYICRISSIFSAWSLADFDRGRGVKESDKGESSRQKASFVLRPL